MIIKKISAGLVSGVMLATMFAGTAFAADAACTITNNQFAHNKCKIVIVNKTKTVQVNKAHVENEVTVASSTGGNEANKNNGVDVTITTGY